MRVRTLAAQLVAPAVTMSVVAEDLREAAVVEVRAPRTLLVNQAVVRELRTEIAVQLGQRSGAHELQHRAQQVVRIRRAAGKLTIGTPLMRSETPFAPVGLSPAEGSPPQKRRNRWR